MSNEEERWVPTPEELEEGKARRGRHERAEKEPQGESKKQRTPLLRRLGVGRRRKYVEVEVETAPGEAPPKVLDSPAKPSEGSTPTARRVESLRIRKQVPAPPKPKYPLHSKEAQFYERATAKGHKMGDLKRVPHTTNFSAVCANCGLEGELVVQREENYATVTYEFFRGRAIERRCSTA